MATHLKEGMRAPSFTGVDQHGNKISLPDFRGQVVVLYFYPQDDTPTCTVQACNLRDNYAELQQHGLKLIGISPDEAEDHVKFTMKYDLPFSLLPDPKHKIIDKYGVWGEKQMFGNKYMGVLRTTFLIDGKGKIIKIFQKPNSANHAAEIIANIPK